MFMVSVCDIYNVVQNTFKAGEGIIMKGIALVIGGKLSIKSDVMEGVKIFDCVTFAEAIGIAKKLDKDKNVEIIISPAGTAGEIQRHISKPIVRTDISDFDIFQTIIEAQNMHKIEGKKIALIMHQSKTIDINRLKPFIKNELIFKNYSNESDLISIIHYFKNIGVELIIGGPTSVKYAEEMGIKGEILLLSEESVLMSINKARETLNVSRRYKLQNERFKLAISLFHDGVLIVNKEGRITDLNNEITKMLNRKNEDIIGKDIEIIIGDLRLRNIYKFGDKLKEKIISVNGNGYFVNGIPIITDNMVEGALITFQEVTKISKLEKKIRNVQASGFYARHYFKDILGESDALSNTIKMSTAFSETDSDILIKGETGVGKELFAQSIHNHSKRKNGPFVAVNCAAFPESLLESELMGYEEGAFTGAKKGGKMGLFELAHEGTIFLDEINQMALPLQGRILRTLQERQVLRLGGDKVTPINVRVIAATNDNLDRLIAEGKFRNDLYYRIAVLAVQIPPLRERTGDISLLITYYFNMFTKTNGATLPFCKESLYWLNLYNWPGNIRELMNFVERYVAINKQLQMKPLEYTLNYLKESEVYKKNMLVDQFNKISIELDTYKAMEKQLLLATLDRFGGNKRQTAIALGISRTSLWKKISDQ